MLEIPYTNLAGKIPKYFEKIQDAGIPQKVDYNWLNQCGFKSTNDRYILAVLNFIGFVDDGKNPTELWKAYKSPLNSSMVLAKGMKQGYNDLFTLYPDANRKDKDTLYAYFSSNTGRAKHTVDLIVNTFTNLCELADFETNAPLENKNEKNSGEVAIVNEPLTIESRTVGVIGLANKIGEFTKRDAEMAMAFGEIASVALANSQIMEILEENEKELRMHYEHLEVLVEERTRDLKNSERLAAIGATAGMVGHDIRNPLQAITSDVYLAKTDLGAIPESADKNNALESLSEIEKNVSYINKIVQDLQGYAKPLRAKLEETDLEQIVQVVIAALVIPENITVTYSIRKDFPKLKTDPSYIQRILTNLSNNAVQAMPKGGKLTIAASSKNGKAAITVQDTGEGIPESVRSKIFNPLVTTKAKGHGFGLSVVKRFTEAMGGTVTFESEVGKGTKFIIELPL